jgi:transposase
LHQLGVVFPAVQLGAPAFHPQMLLTLWLYGYLRKVRSCRKLEEACYHDLGFIWLAGTLHPDHNTLARFLQKHQAMFKRLFRDLVRTAVALELVGLVLHALDGTKIPGAVSKRGAWHRADLAQALATLEAHIAHLVAETLRTAETDAPGGDSRAAGPLGRRRDRPSAAQGAGGAPDEVRGRAHALWRQLPGGARCAERAHRGRRRGDRRGR